jgi:hypothetical protein
MARELTRREYLERVAGAVVASAVDPDSFHGLSDCPLATLAIA